VQQQPLTPAKPTYTEIGDPRPVERIAAPIVTGDSAISILIALGAGTLIPSLLKMWGQRQESDNARRDREAAARALVEAQEHELVKQSLGASFGLTEKLLTQIASLVGSNEATAKQLSELVSSHQEMSKGLQGLQAELLRLGNVVATSNEFMSHEYRQLQDRVAKLEERSS
jgi:homoserine dehydrogenase